MFNKTIIAAAITIALTGCASMNSQEMASQVRKEVKEATTALTAKNNRVQETIISDEPYISGTVVDYVSPNKGNITLTVTNQPLFSVFQNVAEQAKYSTIVTDKVDTKKLVSVDLRKVTNEQAMRDIAQAAGYVVVFDHMRKTATVTDRATYTFKLPKRLFNDQISSKYTISNDPGSSGGGGSAGGQQGGATSSTASMTVSGGSIKNDGKNLEKKLMEMAGLDSELQVGPEAGMIVVRAPAQQLRRVSDFLNNYAKMALQQVEIEVAVVEVSLSDENSTGIDWNKVLTSAGKTWTFGLNTAANVINPSATIGYTGSSVNSVVNLLEKVGNTRTIVRQRLPMNNNMDTTLFSGKKVPYVGKIAQATSGTSGTTTSSGEFTFAMDGSSLVVSPNILDNNRVDLTLIPVLATIDGWETAVIDGNTIRAPIQPLNQTIIPIQGVHGMTAVLGGVKTGKEAINNTGLPGVTGTALNTVAGYNNKVMVQKELVYLVNTKILPAPKFNTLIGVSL